LVAGGYGSSGHLASAEVYDRGLGFQAAWRPVLSTISSLLNVGGRLRAGGQGFRGLSEAFGGTSQDSATNYPLVQLCRVDNEQVRWLRPARMTGFSDTAFTSAPVTGFPAGHALVTVFVNGIPSISRMVMMTASRRVYLPIIVKPECRVYLPIILKPKSPAYPYP
jgi:hypothetical protein